MEAFRSKEMSFNSVVLFRELRILDIKAERDRPPKPVFSSEALPGQSFTMSQHFGQSLAYGLAQQRRNRVSDLFDHLRPIAEKLKLIVKRLKSRSFAGSQGAIAFRVDAAVGGGMDKIHGDRHGRHIAIQA